MATCIDCGAPIDAEAQVRCLRCHGLWNARRAAEDLEDDDAAFLARLAGMGASKLAKELGVSRQAIYLRRDAALNRKKVLKDLREGSVTIKRL